LRGLSAQNHAEAVRIVGAVDNIRGFGHVKEAAVQKVEAEVDAMMARWEAA